MVHIVFHLSWTEISSGPLTLCVPRHRVGPLCASIIQFSIQRICPPHICNSNRVVTTTPSLFCPSIHFSAAYPKPGHRYNSLRRDPQTSLSRGHHVVAMLSEKYSLYINHRAIQRPRSGDEFGIQPNSSQLIYSRLFSCLTALGVWDVAQVCKQCISTI